MFQSTFEVDYNFWVFYLNMGDNTGFIVRCLNKNRNYNFLPKTEKHAYPMVNAIICESFILNPRLDAIMKQFHKVSYTFSARDRKQGKSGRNSSMKSLLNLQNYHFLYTCIHFCIHVMVDSTYFFQKIEMNVKK